MSNSMEDAPRIFRDDDGELLSRPAPILVVPVEKPRFATIRTGLGRNVRATIPIGQYDDYVSLADMTAEAKFEQKQALATAVLDAKIKYDLLKQSLEDADWKNPADILKPIDAPVGSPEWKKEYDAQTYAYVEALNDIMPSDEGVNAVPISDYQPGYHDKQGNWHTWSDQMKQKTAEEASGLPPGSLPIYQVVEGEAVKVGKIPKLQNKPKVALGEKLKKIIALNAAKKKLDRWEVENAFQEKSTPEAKEPADYGDKSHLMGGFVSPYDPGF